MAPGVVLSGGSRLSAAPAALGPGRLLCVRTLAFASHVAHLDPLTGEGLLVLPLPTDDLRDPLGGRPLHEVEWAAVLRHLDALGWEPTEDEDGGLCHVGYTPEGREVVGLYGRVPVLSLPSIPEQAAALHDLAGLAHFT